MEDPMGLLVQRGLAAETPVPPAGLYATTLISRGLLFVAGQIPIREGSFVQPGTLGVDLSLAQGRESATVAMVNALTQMDQALQGDWTKLTRVCRLVVYVAAAHDYEDHVDVADAASQLLADVLGERGRPVRTTVGVASLPFGNSVEVEVTAAVD